MIPKPDYLSNEHASRFQYKGVVDAYHLRPPYPTEVFDILLPLITDEPRAVLDIGCGTGDIARNLVGHVERVDAVDISHNMLEEAKRSPNGNNPHIRWVYGRAEEAPLQSPYALVTAGESLHWMDWYAVMPRFQELLTPHGYLAILTRSADSPLWGAEIMESIQRFST